jgi:hypothetical protein
MLPNPLKTYNNVATQNAGYHAPSQNLIDNYSDSSIFPQGNSSELSYRIFVLLYIPNSHKLNTFFRVSSKTFSAEEHANDMIMLLFH